MHWLREEHEHALTVLRRGLEKILPEGASGGSNSSASTNEFVNRLTLEERLFVVVVDDVFGCNFFLLGKFVLKPNC